MLRNKLCLILVGINDCLDVVGKRMESGRVLIFANKEKEKPLLDSTSGSAGQAVSLYSVVLELHHRTSVQTNRFALETDCADCPWTE